MSAMRPNHRLCALRLCASLTRHGLDPVPSLCEAGLSQTLAEEPQSHVSTAQMVHLSKLVKARLDDDLFGLAAQKIKPGTLQYMFELGMRADTLESLIAHCVRFMAQLVEGLSVQLQRQQGSAQLCMQLRNPEWDPDDMLIDQMLLYWHRVLSWAVGYQLPVTRLDLTLLEHANASRYCYWLSRTWNSGQSQSGFYFDIRYLSLPVTRTPQEWQAQGADRANGLPELPESEQDWSQRLRSLLLADLKQQRQAASLDVAARTLGMVSRTLRRHLDKEGTSYQQVLDGLLRDVAIERLHVQRMHVADVAEQLGFAEPRSFSRAFKRWTGVSPTRYSL